MYCKNLRNRFREVNGVLLLNKPGGVTSNKILQEVKKIFLAQKAGHSGTLDLTATGMLPICLGEATKFLKYLINSNKCYKVTAKLGEKTSTSDSEGKVISVKQVLVNEESIKSALVLFRKKNFQIPPMLSAVKHKGIPLYKYARKGIIIERKLRPIKIHKIKLCHWSINEIELEICCSKGTYIRSIIDDLGDYLGCGAHIIRLHRLSVANYSENDMICIDDLKNILSKEKKYPDYLNKLKEMLLPIDSIFNDMPKVIVPSEITKKIKFGQTTKIILNSEVNGIVCIIESGTRKFIGIGEIVNFEYLKPLRLTLTS